MLQIEIIKQPYVINFSGNPLTYSFAFSPYGFIERRQELKMSLTIQKEVGNSGIFTDIKTEILYPDINGTISINISSIVDAYLKFYMPRMSQITPLFVPGQSSNFRIKALIQKDGVQLGNTIFSNIAAVIKGGLAYHKLNNNAFFDFEIVGNKKPLHFFEAAEKITTNETKYLSWLFSDTIPPATTVSQKVIHTFYDENNIPMVYTVPVPGNAMQWGIYMFEISLYRFLINITALSQAIKNYEIKYFTVQVQTATNMPVVAPVKFVIDYRSHFAQKVTNSSRILAYSNSIGGLDVLHVLGEIDMQAEYSNSNAQAVTPPGNMRNALLVPQVISTEVLETEKFLGTTNFITQKKLDALRDLLLSRNVYEIKDGVFIPVLINKKTVKFYSNRDNLYSMAIEWQHAYSNNFYTPNNVNATGLLCPPLDKFAVIQTAKNKVQILWSMPLPYDLLEVEIDNGTTQETFTLTGNAGSQEINFTNPAVAPGTAVIVIKGKVVCNPDSDPVSYGPTTTVNLTAFANLVPVANPDTFALAAGYNTPQVLPGSVLDNDYDADGDAIEAVAVTSQTGTAGGTYSLSAAGVVTYQPPTAIFNGIDSFPYGIREVANPAVTAASFVNINVGNVGLGNGFYVRIIVRNHQEIGTHPNLTVLERISIGFYADPACTIPKDATGLSVSVNVNNRAYRHINGSSIFDNAIVQTYGAVGTEVEIFYGQTYRIWESSGTRYEDWRVFTLLPGAGYIPV